MGFFGEYNPDDQDPDEKQRADIVNKYLTQKLGGQSPQEMQDSADTQDYKDKLRQDTTSANLMAGLNNASALISGGRYKADNSDLEASNKQRESEIHGIDQSNLARQSQSAKEREDAIKEYLSGKRSEGIQKRILDVNKNTMDERRAAEELRSQSRGDIADTNANARLEAAKIASEGRSAVASGKGSQNNNKDFTTFASQLKGSVRDSIGDEKRKLRATTHALNIVDDHSEEDLNNITPVIANEIGAAVAATLSQGHPAQSTIEHMTPNTAGKDLAKAMEYVTGVPQGAGLAAQMKIYRDMLHRQADVSKGIIKTEISPIVQSYRYLDKKDPDQFRGILNSAGIQYNPDSGGIDAYEPNYKSNTTHTPLSIGQANNQSTKNIDPDAIKFSEMHKIPLDKAAEIIAKRKQQQ